MNSVNLVGRLVKDPFTSTTKSGVSYSNFTLAIDEFGGKEKRTNFISCIAWNKTSELITKYVKKGSLIGVMGLVESSSYKSEKTGEMVFVLKIRVDKVQFLSTSKKNNTEEEEKIEKALDEVKQEIEEQVDIEF